MWMLGEAIHYFLYVCFKGADDWVQLNDDLHHVFVLTDDLVQRLDDRGWLHDCTFICLLSGSNLNLLLKTVKEIMHKNIIALLLPNYENNALKK